MTAAAARTIRRGAHNLEYDDGLSADQALVLGSAGRRNWICDGLAILFAKQSGLNEIV